MVQVVELEKCEIVEDGSNGVHSRRNVVAVGTTAYLAFTKSRYENDISVSHLSVLELLDPRSEA